MWRSADGAAITDGAGSGATRGTVALDVIVDVIGDGGGEQGQNEDIQPVEDSAELGCLVDLVAELEADEGEDKGPGKRAGEGEQQELAEVHAGDAGGQGDVGAHDRQQAREERDGGAVVCEPAVRAVGVGLGDEDVAAVLEQQWATTGGADPV